MDNELMIEMIQLLNDLNFKVAMIIVILIIMLIYYYVRNLLGGNK